MINSLIEALISVIFVYFVLCVLISGFVELWQNRKMKRAKMLYFAIDKALNDPQNKNWCDFLYNHPQIESLKKNYRYYPDYIPGGIFSSVLIDIIIAEGKKIEFINKANGEIQIIEKNKTEDYFDKFRIGYNSLNESRFKQLLESFLIDADNIQKLKFNISKWFDDYMDRLTGWYKSSVRKTTLTFAILLTLVFNIDSIKIFETIQKNNILKLNLIENAEKTIQSFPSNHIFTDSIKGINVSQTPNHDTKILFIQPFDSNSIGKMDVSTHNKDEVDFKQFTISLLSKNSLPFGWKGISYFSDNHSKELGLFKLIQLNLEQITWLQILGWIITIIALTLGAPFWFDIMKKFVNVRHSGKKPTQTSNN